jgi:hypothetical protein
MPRHNKVQRNKNKYALHRGRKHKRDQPKRGGRKPANKSYPVPTDFGIAHPSEEKAVSQDERDTA